MEDKVEIKSNFEKEIIPNITGFKKIGVEEEEDENKQIKKRLSEEDGDS